LRPLACLALLLAAGCTDDPAPRPAGATAPTARFVAGPAQAGYARALVPAALQFPRDHGAHPDFRSEWWYFTGNLADAAGRRFGFQFTVFRFALAPAATRRASAFATRQAWMAHLAITDVDAQRFHAFERFARGAAGLAGAQPHPFAVWLEDWRAEALPAAHAGAEPFPLRLRAGDGEVALDLVLQPGRARVLHGEQGLSRKSAAAGNASYYYSYTRIPASGELRTPAGRFQVAGEAWMDREWSTSALAADQRGWDWFSLQLDDGRDLMFYRLRDAAGGMHAFSAGVLVPPRGQVTHLNAADVALTPLRHWRSPAGGRYPVAWRLRSGQLDLQVHALLDAQEHRAAFRYWEGAVAVRGRDGPRAIAGHGYLEMTAY
jgi:predicted secreted hydrolase